jgi:hypothetical protein
MLLEEVNLLIHVGKLTPLGHTLVVVHFNEIFPLTGKPSKWNPASHEAVHVLKTYSYGTI